MQNVKRYSGMLATIMVIVVAGYAGMAAAGTTCSPGPCNAYYLNGSLAGSATYGCCVDETNDHSAMVVECDNSATTCNIYWENNTLYIDCY